MPVQSTVARPHAATTLCLHLASKTLILLPLACALLLLALPAARAQYYAGPVYSGGAVSITSTSYTQNPMPYALSYNGSYGGQYYVSLSGSDFGTADCSGQVTAAFIWNNGGNTANTPPQAIVVEQYVTADWSQYGLAVSPADCDDGVGQSSADPTGNGQTCTGSDYSVVSNPGASFSVMCSPVASVSGSVALGYSYGYGIATVSYSALAYPVAITLTGATNIGGALEAITGQQITATLNYSGPGTVTSYHWSTSGATGYNPFKTWDPTWPFSTSSNQFVPLGPNDLTQSSLCFYDEADKDQVYVHCTATITFPDGTTGNVTTQSQPVTFEKPTVSWTANESENVSWRVNKPDGCQTTVHPGFFSNGTGNLTYAFGVSELWGPINITEPTGLTDSTVSGSGTGCIAQIASTNRYRKYVYESNYPAIYSLVPVEQNNGITTPAMSGVGLDSAFPYPIGYTRNSDGSYTLSTNTWSAINAGYSADQPYQLYTPSGSSQPLDGFGNDWIDSFASDGFTTWVMYRPPSVGDQETIYVPLQNMTWNWGGEASLDQMNGWDVAQYPAFNSNATLPHNTDVYPSWTQSINGGS